MFIFPNWVGSIRKLPGVVKVDTLLVTVCRMIAAVGHVIKVDTLLATTCKLKADPVSRVYLSGAVIRFMDATTFAPFIGAQQVAVSGSMYPGNNNLWHISAINTTTFTLTTDNTPTFTGENSEYNPGLTVVRTI
jgi:hypothetical protein